MANTLRDKIRCEQDRQKSKIESQRSEFFKKWEGRSIEALKKKYEENLTDVGQAHIQAAVQVKFYSFFW